MRNGGAARTSSVPRAGSDIFFRITAQDRNIMLLAQFNSCVINIHFVTVYDAIISLLWFTIHVISIYSVKAYQGLISVIGNSPLDVWMVRYQAFQYIDQGFESHSNQF